jgi:hypothetical protein
MSCANESEPWPGFLSHLRVSAIQVDEPSRLVLRSRAGPRSAATLRRSASSRLRCRQACWVQKHRALTTGGRTWPGNSRASRGPRPRRQSGQSWFSPATPGQPPEPRLGPSERCSAEFVAGRYAGRRGAGLPGVRRATGGRGLTVLTGKFSIWMCPRYQIKPATSRNASAPYITVAHPRGADCAMIPGATLTDQRIVPAVPLFVVDTLNGHRVGARGGVR